MSSLSVYLHSTGESGAYGPSWSTLHVPPSKHDIKPFLAFLRSELNVSDEYGFKLSISQQSCHREKGETPMQDPNLKPITSVSEFQGLFETLEWQEGSGITLVVELKKKDPAAVAAAAAAAPKFQAPTKADTKPIEVKTPVYVPVSTHTSTTTAPLGSTTSTGAVVGERDPNYRSPFTVGSSSSTAAPSYASLNRFNQSADGAPSEPATRSVTDKLAMFGGASMAVSNRMHNNLSNNSSQPSWVKSSLPPSTSQQQPQPAATGSLIQPSIATVSPPSAQPVTATLVSSLSKLQVVNPPAAAPVAPPSMGDPDLDLPPPPQDFSDPFAKGTAGGGRAVSGSSHPPLPPPPPPPSSASAPVLQVARVFTIGADHAQEIGLPPPPPSQPTSAAGSIQSPSTFSPLSRFLSSLKPSHLELTLFYAQDRFRDMIELARSQIRCYEEEVVSGILPSGSVEKQQASNGLLLHLFHLSLGHTALQEYAEAVAVSKRFAEQYEALPPVLQNEPSNVSMQLQLLYNTGLAQERGGDALAAIQSLTAAANLIERALAEHPDSKFDHRSDIAGALGNLYTATKKFDDATLWHDRATALEDCKQTGRKWSIYHAAASCYAQKGDYERAIALDTQASDLLVAAGVRPNPRIYFNRGLCLQKLRPPKFHESIADFTRVIEADPKSMPKAYTLRARALFGEEDFARVVEDCSAALKLAPADAQARDLLALAQKQLAGAVK